MKYDFFGRQYLVIAIELMVIGLIGVGSTFSPLDKLECGIISILQNFINNNLCIQFFLVVTYLGDFYVWLVFSIVFFCYAYFKRSIKNLNISLQIVIYFILITASTFFLKLAFARPRPSCVNVTIYMREDFFSYPSGHVSRAAGLIMRPLWGKSYIKLILGFTAVLLVSLSRIIIGVHYPTDVLGALFLSQITHKATGVVVYSIFKSISS